MVVTELRGEKIDIVPFSEDLSDFVAKALSPAKVSQVNISDDGTQADVIVPDHQLSLAIGREGQNAVSRPASPACASTSVPRRRSPRACRAGGYADDVEYAEGEWVANAETGEMEWHAADGSVMSQAEWVEQLGGGEPAEADADAAARPPPSRLPMPTVDRPRRSTRPARRRDQRRRTRTTRGRWRSTVIPTARSERASGAARGARRPNSSAACSAQTASRASIGTARGVARGCAAPMLRARGATAGVRPGVAHGGGR